MKIFSLKAKPCNPFDILYSSTEKKLTQGDLCLLRPFFFIVSCYLSSQSFKFRVNASVNIPDVPHNSARCVELDACDMEFSTQYPPAFDFFIRFKVALKGNRRLTGLFFGIPSKCFG